MFIFSFFVFFILSALCVNGLETSGSFTPIPLDLTVQNPYPANNSNNIPRNVTVSVDVNSSSGSVMNLSWYENSTDVWLLVQENLSVVNGTYTYEFVNSSNYSTVYYWRVCANDGLGNFNNKTFCFRTLSFVPLLSISNVFPLNNSIINTLVPTLYFNITHRDGGLMNYTVFWNGTSEVITSVFDVGNGTCYHPFVNATSYGSYNWSIHLNNGSFWVNESFVFIINNISGLVVFNFDSRMALGVVSGIIVMVPVIVIFWRRRNNEVEKQA